MVLNYLSRGITLMNAMRGYYYYYVSCVVISMSDEFSVLPAIPRVILMRGRGKWHRFAKQMIQTDGKLNIFRNRT